MSLEMIRADVAIEDYVRDSFHDGPPSLSASVAHRLVSESPRHARNAHPRLNPAWEPASSEQMDVGTIVHALLLEDDRSRIVVVEAKDWRTTAARAMRDAARAEGKLPILADRMAEVEEMLDVARTAIARSELADVFADGEPELTLLWQEGDALCRSRPDWVSRDQRVLVDLKTTATKAEPNAWARQIVTMGYDIQAAFGLRGIHVLKAPHEPAFVFMVQETDPPYAVSFVGLSPQFLEWAEAKRREAVTTWSKCLARNVWPAYPARIAWVDPPAWALTQWTDRMVTSGAYSSASTEGAVDDL